MAAADDLQDTKDALTALMKAKAEGASDLSEFYDRRLGALGITAASSLKMLIGLLKDLDEAISRESGGTFDTTVVL